METEGALYKAKGREHSQYGKGYLREGNKNGMFGKKHKKETIEKIINHPNRKHFGKNNGNFGKGLIGSKNPLSIAVEAIDIKTGEIIEIYESISLAIKSKKVTHWAIHRIINGHKEHYQGIAYKLKK